MTSLLYITQLTVTAAGPHSISAATRVFYLVLQLMYVNHFRVITSFELVLIELVAERTMGM